MLLQLIKMFDETAFSLRLDLAREKKLTEEAEERHEKEVADEIIRIADRCGPACPPQLPAKYRFDHRTPPDLLFASVDQERRQRLDGEESLLKRINDEIHRLKDTIEQEAANRQELDQRVTRMMEEKTMLLKVELMKEKKLREEAEDRMAREIQEEINQLSERIDQVSTHHSASGLH